MMLFAPSSAICSWALALMPSPMASSQMTLATPMKMPSTVSSERSGWSSRLFTPSCEVRSMRRSADGEAEAARLSGG